MEEIENLITGCFVQYEEHKNELIDSEEEDEEGGGEDIQWLGYKEVSDMNGGKSFVSYEKPKLKTGELVDIASRIPQKCRGPILLYKQWWQVTFLRTKVARDKFKEPKDRYALCYRLRDDQRRYSDNLAQLLISDVLIDRLVGNPSLQNTRQQFDNYIRETNVKVDLFNLQEHLEEFSKKFSKSENEDEIGPQEQFMNAIINSLQFQQAKLGQTHPQLLHYLPQLFPFHFIKILQLKEDILDGLVQCIIEEPANMAFKAILSKQYNVLGVETSKEALIKSGLMSKVPQIEQDAIEIYEFLKKETKEYGHTWVKYERIISVLGKHVKLPEEAITFLNKHKVTKTQMEAGHRIVYLNNLWKAENQIAKGLNSLIRKHELQPWNLNIDFSREDFQSIMSDNDQKRAAQLISSHPVCAISGKGGCGKTYVVSKVLTAAQAQRSKAKLENDEDGTQPSDDMTQMDLPDDPVIEDPSEERCPDDVNILLTAPTGKAANLLGKRAELTSCTLHQVIWSYRMLAPGSDWKHKDVTILVVDECSLVSVSTMAFLLELLLKHSKLRRVVLLGDIRQLPSIEPGNFLKDTFQSLHVIGCSVELRTNHRSESQSIVDNATAISNRQYPVFDKEKFIFRRLPESSPENSGNDYMLQDINDDITKLLSHQSLKSHINSQFISFTRRVCEAVNDLCCKHYSKHRIKEFKKFIFRTGDKICCSKNGYVNIYEEKHGLMSCAKDPNEGKKQEAGGVDRTILTGTVDDTVIGEDGDKTLNPEQNSENKQPSTKKIRLCNGEIFFITEELEKQTDDGKIKTFLGLSEDGDHEKTFWVEKRQLRKACEIRHAWARTIHTFQGSETDHVVYIVGSRSWRQNWQHVYTAVTRGRKTVFIIGQESILRSAIRRPEIRRQTGLKKQLLQLFQKDKLVSPTHAVDSSILCPVEKPGTSKRLAHTAQWVAGCPKMSLNTKFNMPSTSRVVLDDSVQLNNTQTMTDILSSLASEHDHHINMDTLEDDTCPPDDISNRDSPSLLQQISETERTDGHSFKQCKNNSVERTLGVEKKEMLTDSEHIEEYSSGNEDLVKQSSLYACDKSALSSSRLKASEAKLKPMRMKVSSRKENFVGKGQIAHHEQFVLFPQSLQTSETAPVDNSVGDNDIADDNFDTDSDNSESLLASPAPRKSYSLLKARACQSGKTNSGDSSVNNTGSTDNRTIFVHNDKSALHEGLSPIMPVTCKSHQTTDSLDGVNARTRSTSNNTSRLSPVAPLFVANQNAQKQLNHKTSSPVVDQTSLNSNRSVSKAADSASAGVSVIKSSGLESTSIDIKEPHSNESLWSEADDSDLLNITDSQLVSCQCGDINKSSSAFCSQKTIKSCNKDSPYTLLKIGLLNSSTNKTPEVVNQSSCSQWSEVDDEQYITALDLVDIQNMATQKYPTGTPSRDSLPCSNYKKIDEVSTPDLNEIDGSQLVNSQSYPIIPSNETDGTPPKDSLPFNNYRKPEMITPPELDDDDDSIIMNTPLVSSSMYRSPTGIKRQLSWKQNEVSPMKRRFATLKFE